MSNLSLIISLLSVIAVSNIESASILQTSGEDLDWWEHSVIYQIYPRSFKDSNNDGLGDLQGIISKLEHLKDAGVTAAWLSPIYKSPQVDHGYDISDFKDVDEIFGNLNDFDELVQKAHDLGIKIVMDFVPNHSSDQHEWFKKSVNKEAGYEDFYIWKDGTPDTPPNNWISLFKGSAWTYNDVRKQWYLHQFAKEQPDLNYRSTALLAEMKEVLKFWLDKNVDGFRFDAVPYLIEDEKFEDEPLSGDPNSSENDHNYLTHIYTSDHPGTFDIIYEFREFIDEYTKSKGGSTRVIMTEAYTDIKNTMLYYGNGGRKGGHFTFNFQLITRLNKESSARDIVLAVKEWLTYMPLKNTPNWVLGNHDQHRVATRFGSENVDGFNMFTAILPGVMITYNGEEIGQENGEVTFLQGQDPSACKEDPEKFDDISRDFERTPFHWDDTNNAGFTETGTPWLPVSSKYLTNNLKAQSDSNVASHYQVYKQLVDLRTKETLSKGKLELEALSDTVLGCTRTLAGSDSYLYLFNIGLETATINITDVFPSFTSNLEVVVSSTGSEYKRGTQIAADKFTLNPHESIIAAVYSTPDDNDDGGATGVTVSIFVLAVALYSTLFL